MHYVTTSMNLKGIMLNEINQSQKDKYCLTPLTWGLKNIEFIESKNKMVVVGGGGKKKQSYLSTSIKFQLKVSSKDLCYSIVSIVNNNVLRT